MDGLISKNPSKGILESRIILFSELIESNNHGISSFKELIASSLIPSKTILINNKEFSLSAILDEDNKPFLMILKIALPS